MKKFITMLSVAALLALVGCSTPVDASAPLSSQESQPQASEPPASQSLTAPPSTPAAVPDPGIADPTTGPSEPSIIVQRSAPAAGQPESAVATMSVDEVCSVWKEGFAVLEEGSVSAKEAMTPLEDATAAAPPEIRVQSGIAVRILWGQILYPSDQPASAEAMGYLLALGQACYDLTGINVAEGVEG